MVFQLALSVKLRDDATFNNFYRGDNQELIAHLQNAFISQAEQFIYFWGPKGVGKSHLLQACCHAAAEKGLTATYLPLTQYMEFTPDVLEGLEELNLICVDDVDAIAGKIEWEEALFHLYNRIRETKACLIVAANNIPSKLGVKLADLTSRLTWGLLLQLQELSDADKLSALQSRAKARGLNLTDEVGQFLLRRCPRDMNSLFTILERLDQASLAAQRKLTIPFIKAELNM